MPDERWLLPSSRASGPVIVLAGHQDLPMYSLRLNLRTRPST